MSVALHWFRKGLRLHDNEALTKAIESSSHLIPLYILDQEYLNPNRIGTNRLGFLLDTLNSLDEDLKACGSQLFVSKGKPVDTIEKFIRHFNIKVLTFEKDTEPYNKSMDTQITDMALSLGLKVHTFWGHTLYKPDCLLSLNNGKAPLTMASFLKLISVAGPPSVPLRTPLSIPPPPTPSDRSDWHKLRIFHGVPSLAHMEKYGYSDEAMTTWFRGGEKEALKRMNNFLAQKERVSVYEKSLTDPSSLVPDSTALSPYLANGCLSVRMFYHKIKEAIQMSSVNQPRGSLESQIYNRELAYLIGYATPNFNQMIGNPICVCMQIPWITGDEAEDLLDRWEHGLTGYPAVDACMNQLRRDGWIHHKARDLVACFLTRGDLLVHWEMGRDVFEKYLIDADWSVNNFQWHWLSCSAFFYQYFSSHDPTSFFKTWDPSGIYVRKYVPVLSRFPDEYIYEPWLAPNSIQHSSRCMIGKDYPEPMVHHSNASQDNLCKIKNIAMAYN